VRAQSAEEEVRKGRRSEAEAMARALRAEGRRSKLETEVARLQGQTEEMRRALEVAEDRARGAELRLVGAAAATPYRGRGSAGKGGGVLALPGGMRGSAGEGMRGGRSSALEAGQELLSSSMQRFHRATEGRGGEASGWSSRASSPGGAGGRVASRGMMADAIG